MNNILMIRDAVKTTKEISLPEKFQIWKNLNKRSELMKKRKLYSFNITGKVIR